MSFFRRPVALKFERRSDGSLSYLYNDEPDFIARGRAAIIPSRIKAFEEKATEGPITEANYDPIENQIVFYATVTNVVPGLTTWDEIANYYALVSLETDTSVPKIKIKSLTLSSTAGNFLNITDFKPIYENQLSYLFLTRVPSNAKWSRPGYVF